MTRRDDDRPPRAGERWEAALGEPSARAGTPPIHVVVVRAVAEAVDADPLDLPPLNDVVDPDALCVLAESMRWRAGGWPTIEFRYLDHRVSVTGPASATVEPVEAVPSTGPDRWPHLTRVDGDDESLTERLVTVLGERTGRDPEVVRDAIDAAAGRFAVARLNRPRANGKPRVGATLTFAVLGQDVVVSPDGSLAVGSTLERLARTGCNLLVVGAVPDGVTDHVSASLLCDPGQYRRRLFALLDRGADAARSRLELLADPVGPAHVLAHATPARSDDDASKTLDADLTIESVDGDHETFLDAVERVVDGVGTDLDDERSPSVADPAGGDAPADPAPERSPLHLCVDSIRPLVEQGDPDRVRRLLASLCDRVDAASGIAHYVLPVARDTPVVSALDDLFDATIELRVDETGPVQRWHLHDGSHRTEVVELEPPASP